MSTTTTNTKEPTYLTRSQVREICQRENVGTHKQNAMFFQRGTTARVVLTGCTYAVYKRDVVLDALGLR